jgi:hypothetical protein
MNNKFKSLNKTIIKCKKCPRLTNFIKKISKEKRKQNINEMIEFCEWRNPIYKLLGEIAMMNWWMLIHETDSFFCFDTDWSFTQVYCEKLKFLYNSFLFDVCHPYQASKFAYMMTHPNVEAW